jgi:hypothetical protein
MRENVQENKVWDRIMTKWASFAGNRLTPEHLNDASIAASDEMDDVLRV